MPFQSYNYDDFMYYIGKLDSLFQAADTPYVYAIGDFNADVFKSENNVCIQSHGVNFGRELKDFCNNQNLLISDIIFLDGITNVHTYI